MGLGVSRLPQWDDNHSGCPLISTGIAASIKLETLRDERNTAVRVNTCDASSGLCATCCAHVWMFCVNWMSVRGRKKKLAFFFSFVQRTTRWVNLCFMEIKYGPHLPPCLQMVPVERGWLSGPSQPGNLRVLMLGGQCGATPSLLSPGAWIRSPLPAPCLWSSPSLLHNTNG